MWENISDLPADLKYLPQRAMKIWFENEECLLPEEDLERLRDYLVDLGMGTASGGLFGMILSARKGI